MNIKHTILYTIFATIFWTVFAIVPVGLMWLIWEFFELVGTK